MPSNKDYDELELAYTITNMGRLKIFDKRKRYFSFNESSNHSIENSSEKSGLRNDNYKHSGKTPSFAPGYQMRSFKGKFLSVNFQMENRRRALSRTS